MLDNLSRKINLTLKERKILYLLHHNSRIPITQIAKRVKCSRELVHYSVRRLSEKGLIKKYTMLVDFNRLNYRIFNIYVKFKNESSAETRRTIDYLMRQTEGIFRFGTSVGTYDIVAYVIGTNIFEVERVISKVKQILHGKTIRVDYLRLFSSIVPPYNFLLSTGEIKSLGKLDYSQFDQRSEETYILTKDQKKVLNALYENPTMKIHNLAAAVNLSPHRTKKIFATLMKDKIIIGFSLISRLSVFNYGGLSLFEVLLRFNEDEKNTKKKFEQYLLLECPFSSHVLRYLLGKYDYKINIFAKNNNDLKSKLNKLNLQFVNNIEIDTILSFGIGEEDSLLQQPRRITQNIFK